MSLNKNLRKLTCSWHTTKFSFNTQQTFKHSKRFPRCSERLNATTTKEKETNDAPPRRSWQHSRRRFRPQQTEWQSRQHQHSCRCPSNRRISDDTSTAINTLCLKKKFPPLNSLQLCQILTDFQNFCNAEKRMKFATKRIRHYPSHLRHVATLPWEIRNSNFLQIFSRYGKWSFLQLTNIFQHVQCGQNNFEIISKLFRRLK